jgi:hypothetical protein
VITALADKPKPLMELHGREAEHPRTLGLVLGASGRIATVAWGETADVQSMPVVAAGHLAGRYEAGLTHLEHLAARPDELRLVEEIGEVDTAWVVYGTQMRFCGEVIGISSAELVGPRVGISA